MPEEHIEALNLLSNGDWDGAHQLIQDVHDELACQIHGHLHRAEGDLSNASYWYSRIGLDLPETSLEEEFERLFQLSQASSGIDY